LKNRRARANDLNYGGHHITKKSRLPHTYQKEDKSCARKLEKLKIKGPNYATRSLHLEGYYAKNPEKTLALAAATVKTKEKEKKVRCERWGIKGETRLERKKPIQKRKEVPRRGEGKRARRGQKAKQGGPG